MAQRIEVYSKFVDSRAQVLQKKMINQGFEVSQVILVDVYTLNLSLSARSLQKCAKELVNPVVQNYNLNSFRGPEKFSWAIEIGFLPGVTDNLAATARESFQDLLRTKFAETDQIFSSQIIYLGSKLSGREIQQLADSLINPLIQRVQIKNFDQFTGDEGLDIILPQVKLEGKTKVNQINLEISDDQLMKLSEDRVLALSLPYLKTIQNYFKKLNRQPNDIELESLAQTWSEHCKHTIFRDPIDEVKEGLFKKYIQGATKKINSKICASVFTDNSGAIVFDKDYLVTDKVETHNSPSALDPFGGAITGIVGVNRDTLGFGLGAKPIINRFGFCFGDPVLSSRRIIDGVVRGVNSGGNCSGIPTPQGFAIFDPSFAGKPLVFVGTIGLIPAKYKTKKAKPGDLIIMVGGRVGKDGIHGATFSSQSLTSYSPAAAVQIGDPITQKKFSDALVKEARNLNLYNSITDNGAGGLSCSVAEMAKESGGCEVYLEKVPLKYPGLYPWEIWVSESQERMTLAVPAKKWPKLQKLLEKRGVESNAIGEFTDSGRCLVKYKAQTIMDIDLDFLHEGLPPKKLTSQKFSVKLPQARIPKKIDYENIILEILTRPNIAGKEFLFLQYDHEVQAGSVVKPLQGRGRILGDCSITRPRLSSNRAVIFSQGLFPWYSRIDSYRMAACSIDTAVRNAVSGGANLEHLALLDNFCWSLSNNPERLWQLKQACQACFDTAVGFGTPFISGKDSMFNDFSGFDDQGHPVKISCLPTLLISTLGVIDDYRQAVTLDVKMPGDLIYFLGDTYPELGASEFYYYLSEKNIGGQVPKVNLAKNKKLYQAVFAAVKQQLLASAVSVGRGGLAVALAKCSMAGKLGLNLDLRPMTSFCQHNYEVLFSESMGRFIVTVNPKNQLKFDKIMQDNPCYLIGKVTKKPKLVIKKITDLPIINMLKAYKSTFKNF